MEKYRYTVAENLEKIRQKQPDSILLGAILSQGNSLPINKDRFYDLMRAMQANNFEYPDSMKSIVDSVTFNESGKKPVSEQIESMFARISITKKVDFVYDETGGGCLQLPKSTINDFAEQFAGDAEALSEFFERCGDYLSAPTVDTVEIL